MLETRLASFEAMLEESKVKHHADHAEADV
jgi:hypothetical protein